MPEASDQIKSIQELNHVVLIDGVCNLCVLSVRILHKLEPSGLLKFTSQQSEIGTRLLAEHGIPVNELNTIFYLENGVLYEKSTAILVLSKHLKQPYKFLGMLAKIVPRFLRDMIYRLIARYRYLIFGKREVCYLGDSDLAERFL